jgi:oligoendopeptidase F
MPSKKPAAKTRKTGAEKIRWDLASFYKAPTDPAVARDLAQALALMADFEETFRGQLGRKLGAALLALQHITRLTNKLGYYFFLATSCDTSNAALRKGQSRVEEALAAARAKHLTFFDLELAKLSQADLNKQYRTDKTAAQHRPMVEHTRKLATHFLSEEVETALTLREPFGPHEWDDMMDELESGLRITFEGRKWLFPEILHVLEEERDSKRRAAALKAINGGLASQRLTYFQTRALNVMLGEKMTDDAQRNFTHPMAARNLSNKVDEATVEALHKAVSGSGVKLARRFYKLKARLLGLKALKWSDRNAQMPFAVKRQVSWDEACRIVHGAYAAFSPTLGKLVARIIKEGWIDAPPQPAKVGGAYDASVPLPGEDRTYVLMNYLGSPRDVATLAHELGHAVHGLLALEAQGPLMWHAPMVYAETASVFGEMLTFEHLLSATESDTERLALLMDKMNDFLNTVVRQICFSAFEQRIHARRREGKLATADFAALWQEVTVQFYGKSGEVFSYADMDNMWSYIGHFHTPFYVYAYAFGELFTQSLMAARPRVGAKFEPLYLNLLRAGDTKDAVALLAPFGLNPTAPDFWGKGLAHSLGRWLDEAERLADSLKKSR